MFFFSTKKSKTIKSASLLSIVCVCVYIFSAIYEHVDLIRCIANERWSSQSSNYSNNSSPVTIVSCKKQNYCLKTLIIHRHTAWSQFCVQNHFHPEFILCKKERRTVWWFWLDAFKCRFITIYLRLLCRVLMFYQMWIFAVREGERERLHWKLQPEMHNGWKRRRKSVEFKWNAYQKMDVISKWSPVYSLFESCSSLLSHWHWHWLWLWCLCAQRAMHRQQRIPKVISELTKQCSVDSLLAIF